jgi:hypothetical protein
MAPARPGVSPAAALRRGLEFLSRIALLAEDDPIRPLSLSQLALLADERSGPADPLAWLSLSADEPDPRLADRIA